VVAQIGPVTDSTAALQGLDCNTSTVGGPAQLGPLSVTEAITYTGSGGQLTIRRI